MFRQLIDHASFVYITFGFIFLIGLVTIFHDKFGPFRRIIPIATISLLFGFLLYHTKFLRVDIDDAFISFRYVKNFITGNGLVFNVGEKVEGYTNFLWIIILSAFGKFGLDIVLISKLLGVFCTIGTVLVTYNIAGKVFEGKKDLIIIALVWLIANGTFVLWAFTGMETALFTMLLTLAFLMALREKYLLLGIVLSLLSLTRPEGALFSVVAVFYMIFIKRIRNISRLIALILPLIIIASIYIIWKLHYYGNLFPNTFYAKQGDILYHIKMGLLYLGQYFIYFDIFTVFIIIAVINFKKLPDFLRLTLICIAVYLIYIILVGGDWMLGFRFISGVVPLLTLISIYGLYLLLSQLRFDFANEKARQWLIAGCLLMAFLQNQNSILQVEFKLNALEYQANADDSYLTAKWLKENLPEKTIIATYMVGAYGYYTDLYFIDLLGLTDPVIAKSKGFSQGWIGHESYNIDYVLRKKPDMFILGSGKLAHNIPLEKASLMPPEVDKEAFCTEYDMKSLNLSSNKNRPKYLNCWVRRDSPIISY